MNTSVHKKIYKTALEALSGKTLSHKALIDEITRRLYGDIKADGGRIGEFTEVRGIIGTVINEMRTDGVILSDNRTYIIGAETPLTMRLESCEKEILLFLSSAPKTKQQIRSHLRVIYGTNKTESENDDRILYDHIGQILRRMISERKIKLDQGRYSLCDQTRANADDIGAMLELKSSFIQKIHRNGGEFFEHYIMTLLGLHQKKHGKNVIECRTTGGTSDGGIDGIMKTIDSLGFKETVMIQAKNRTDITTETTLRGFYGALCASGGTRGIFATMSDFHPSAKIFLSGIDNCVGINGDDIFKMACDCQYGIKKKNGKLMLDDKIL